MVCPEIAVKNRIKGINVHILFIITHKYLGLVLNKYLGLVLKKYWNFNRAGKLK